MATLRLVFRTIPEAPRSLDAAEDKAFRTMLPHLDDFTEDDWHAHRAWFSAPDHIRGRSRWPRTRLEWLRNLFETAQQVRLWWGRAGTKTKARAWWAKQHAPPPSSSEKPTSEPTPGEAIDDDDINGMTDFL